MATNTTNSNYLTNASIEATEEAGYSAFWAAEEDPSLADHYLSNPHSTRLQPELHAAWARGVEEARAEG